MLTKFFPFLAWFKGYRGSDLRADALAGLTVALVLIPQSMAYAQLAGLPPYYGLYASFLPPMVAALFGSSRQLGTGPVAVVSLMSAASLESLATAGSAEFIAYSIAMAFIVGFFQFLLGALRLGLVVNFLSHPVVNGFTNAAAIIIASSQFSSFFGVDVDSSPHHYETMVKVVQAALDYTHLPTLVYGVGAVVIMVVLRKINPRIPNVLIAVAITTAISYFTGFNNDRFVDVSVIQSAEVRETISQFNRVVSLIKERGQERAELGKSLEALRKSQDASHGPTLEQIDLQGKINLVTAQLEQAKAEARDLRLVLRNQKFSGVEEARGPLYYLKGEVPPGVAVDETIWRIKIKNSPLDLGAIKLTGGGAIIGKVPEGLPEFTVPAVNLSTLGKLLPTAIIIALLGFMEAIAIAKAMASKTGQKLNPNQELIGQGLANMIGSFSSSYTVSGSFSRSAVNLQAGAVSGISSVVTSLCVVLTLFFFTPLLYHLPQATLAAVIMMAVVGLINTHGFVHAWKAQWYDGAISIITFFVTLAFAPHLDKGIMVGVALSMGVFLYKSMRPVVAELSMDEDMAYRNAEYYRLKGCRHICVVRFDGALFFANASYLDEQVIKFRTERPDLRYILLDASGINDMDASGEEALALLVSRVRAAGMGFAISSAKSKILEVMKRTYLYDKIGKENFYPDTKSAVERITDIIHHQTDLPPRGCKNCPLTQYVPE